MKNNHCHRVTTQLQLIIIIIIIIINIIITIIIIKFGGAATSKSLETVEGMKLTLPNSGSFYVTQN